MRLRRTAECFRESLLADRLSQPRNQRLFVSRLISPTFRLIALCRAHATGGQLMGQARTLSRLLTRQHALLSCPVALCSWFTSLAHLPPTPGRSHGNQPRQPPLAEHSLLRNVAPAGPHAPGCCFWLQQFTLGWSQLLCIPPAPLLLFTVLSCASPRLVTRVRPLRRSILSGVGTPSSVAKTTIWPTHSRPSWRPAASLTTTRRPSAAASKVLRTTERVVHEKRPYALVTYRMRRGAVVSQGNRPTR